MKRNIQCYTENITLHQFGQLPSEIQSYSNTVENSLYSLIKLYTPLREIVSDKYFGIKKNYPHHLFYVKLYALSFIDGYDKIDLQQYECKIFPQTNLDIFFKGQVFNINSKGTLSIKDNPKKVSAKSLKFTENQSNYKITIDGKDYLLVISFDNKIEIDGILKAKESFNLLDTFKTKILYFKNDKNRINFMKKNYENFEYRINKNSTIIIDIKSFYSIESLIRQIEFHDEILYNLLETCDEDLKKYYYLFILNDKNRNKTKEEKLNNFLQRNKLKLNIIVLLTEQSTICGQDFEVVIDKEYLSSEVNTELRNIRNHIENLHKKQDRFETALNNIKNEIVPNINNEMVTTFEEMLKKNKEEMAAETKKMLDEKMEEMMMRLNQREREENNNNNGNSFGIISFIKRWFGYD